MLFKTAKSFQNHINTAEVFC